jgi:small GTP-binding protein
MSSSSSSTHGCDYVIKLLTLGDTSVGKTSILLQYTQGYFPKKALSTIGVDFRTKYVNLPNGKHVKVLLWDTAGQERFRNIADNYYNGSDCVLFVFDITSKSSFEMLSFWMERLKAKRNLDDIVMILVGNKKDLLEKRTVQLKHIQEMQKEIQIKYFEVSALENIGIDGMFEYIVKESVDLVIKRDWDNHSETLSGINKLNINKNLKTKSSNRDGCCS